ncbi:MAG TPA: AAA family ATPase, partial [Polyangiales bacterium]|nr:AAA family ATPase [Polyangiales bacterium]
MRDAELGGTAEEGFVGRELEIDELSAELNRTLRGRPRCVLLRGDAGVGKTRLLREFSGIARRLGMQVVQGRAMEDSATPYLPFLNVFDTCAGESERSASSESLSQLMAASAAPSDRADDVAYERVQRFGSSIRQIVAFAKREPLLIVLDDLHWADAPSLELLGQLLFVVADEAADERLPLLVIAAQRPVPPTHRLQKLNARLLRERIVRGLELRGLSADETGALLTGLGVTRAARQLIDAVQRSTHGYPLFVQEMLHHLESQGLLEHGAGQTSVKALPGPLELPRDVSSALSQRLVSMSERELDMLTLAALVSDGFTLARLSAIANSPAEALSTVLDRAIDAELIVLEGGSFHFRHPLIRELLASRASPLRRQLLHRQIAGALVKEPASGALSLEIAHHLLASSDADPRALLHHAHRGADHAFSLFAWGDAGRLYA